MGGLNIVMFGAFVAFASKFGFGVRHHRIIEGFVSRDSILSSKGMMGKIFIWSIVIEIISSLLIYILWDPNMPFKSREEKVFFSVFHAMSAFNNAGFSLFGNGLTENHVNLSYSTHFILAILIILGGIGFYTLQDIFSLSKIRERRSDYNWKNFSG